MNSPAGDRIREAAPADGNGIRGVHLRAFPAGENQLVAMLAVNLLGEETEPRTFALVAELGGDIVGHVAFSPVLAAGRHGWTGYILAPLGVMPELQKTGIGSQLVESGMERLAGQMANAVFVYGDPKYYGRFGFSAEAAARFVPPYELKYPFGWQARVLQEGLRPDEVVKLSCVPSLRDPALW